MTLYEKIYAFWYEYDWDDLNELAQQINECSSAEWKTLLVDYFKYFMSTDKGFNHELYLFRDCVDDESLSPEQKKLYDEIINELNQWKGI